MILGFKLKLDFFQRFGSGSFCSTENLREKEASPDVFKNYVASGIAFKVFRNTNEGFHRTIGEAAPVNCNSCMLKGRS